MSDRTSHAQQMQDSTNTFPQSVVYAYPPSVAGQDEIDLGELIGNLLKQWKLMLIIVTCGSLLSVVIASSMTNIFRVSTTLSLPTAADVSPFVTNGLNVGLSRDIFKRFYNQVRSLDQFANYAIKNDYLPKLFPESALLEDQMADSLMNNFSVLVTEPLPSTKGALVSQPERIRLELMHPDEALIAELLRAYVNSVGTSLVKKIKQEQNVVIGGKINLLETKIGILRVKAKEERLAEISRLDAGNKEEIENLNQQIKTSIVKATADTKDRIIQINESRSVAESLGIVYPTELKEIKGSDAQGGRLQTLVKVNDNDTLPMFLMGTRYLDSLIKSIEGRENEAAFVSDLNGIRRKIALINNDTRLAALIARTSDDPYIPELPDIQAKIAELKSLSLDFSGGQVFTLEKDVLSAGYPIEPNKILIVVLGVVMSGVLALLVGIIVIASSGKRE